MKTVLTIPPDVVATFEDGKITCDDPAYLKEINVVVADLLDSPSLPDFDYWRASLVVDALQGEITEYDGPPEDQEDNTVY